MCNARLQHPWPPRCGTAPTVHVQYPTRTRLNLQDSTFTDVAAVNLFWSWRSLVVVDEVTYSNVTTKTAQWDDAGDVVGDGNGDAVLWQYGSGLEVTSSVDALESIPASLVQQLRADDPWFDAVKQVLSTRRLEPAGPCMNQRNCVITYKALEGVRAATGRARTTDLCSEVQAIAAATPAQIRAAPDPPLNPAPTPPLGVAGGAPPSVAAVYSAKQFQDAFHEGVRDIEIRAHLDLRNLSFATVPIVAVSNAFKGPYPFGVVGPSTRSIRVRVPWCCSTSAH